MIVNESMGISHVKRPTRRARIARPEPKSNDIVEDLRPHPILRIGWAVIGRATVEEALNSDLFNKPVRFPDKLEMIDIWAVTLIATKSNTRRLPVVYKQALWVNPFDRVASNIPVRIDTASHGMIPVFRT